jgi:hypothetical protein
MMRLPLLTAAACLLRLAHAETIIPAELQPVHIFYQPVTQPTSNTKASPLAAIRYNPATLETEIISYTPPKVDDTLNQPETSHPLFRISTGSPHGSTTVTSLASFNPAYTQILTLHVNDDNLVSAASISADPLTRPRLGSPDLNLKVVLLRPTPGPTPKLNVKKPVVVDAEGKEVPQVPEVEKTFLQKYWWAFALVAVLALTGGGDK